MIDSIIHLNPIYKPVAIAKNDVFIRYGNIAPEAKENFFPSASENEFDTLAQLQQYNLNFPNYANPCELYQTVLDGTAEAFPSMPENANLGLWSEQISNDDGIFATPIVLTLTSDGKYTSEGLTLTFDVENGIYPNHISIVWYRDGKELSREDFFPDSASYYCENKVDFYNKVEITFFDLNMPKNRLKLRSIDYGYGVVFQGDELKGVKLIQEIDPISSEISINTGDFTVYSKSGIEFSFTTKQPISVYFNGRLQSTVFVKKSVRKTKSTWQIQGEDYIGILDGIYYYGGIYNNVSAGILISDIFSVANVPYSIENGLNDIIISGYIPYTTCREALMQVAFAIQAVVDTSNSDVVKIFSLDDEVKQKIPLDRIFQGQNFPEDDAVTGVEVVSHTYKAINEESIVYEAEESGTGNGIFVKFSEPMHTLNIINGEILESGANYARIDAYSGCVLSGKKYEHTMQTKRLDNPYVLASEAKKIASISNATLVSANNIDNVLNKCYNYITKTKGVRLRAIECKRIMGGEYIKYGEQKYGSFKYGEKSAKIVIRDKPINIGEMLDIETEYLGNIVGRNIKQTFSLSGGTIVKDIVIKGDK